MSGCSYMTVCDSGIVTADAGPTCTAFVSPTDFAGTYSLVPSQSQACGGANYDISEVTISVASGTVTVVTGTSGSMTLTGTMTAADSFDVTRTSGSNTFRLTGTFACRQRFMGHWTATLGGFGCVNQDVDVRGSRR